MVKTTLKKVVPLQPMVAHGGAAIQLQPVEDPMLEQVHVSKGSCEPMENPCWSRSSGRTCEPTGDRY